MPGRGLSLLEETVCKAEARSPQPSLSPQNLRPPYIFGGRGAWEMGGSLYCRDKLYRSCFIQCLSPSTLFVHLSCFPLRKLACFGETRAGRRHLRPEPPPTLPRSRFRCYFHRRTRESPYIENVSMASSTKGLRYVKFQSKRQGRSMHVN